MAGEWRLLEETWISSELVVTPESRPTKTDPSWSRSPEEIPDDESPVFSVEAEENQVPRAHTNTDSSRELRCIKDWDSVHAHAKIFVRNYHVIITR